jgi:hypothetical protein
MALKKKGAVPKRHGRRAVPPARKRRKKTEDEIVESVAKLARELAALPVLHDVDPDEWFYDERGLPR